MMHRNHRHQEGHFQFRRAHQRTKCRQRQRGGVVRQPRQPAFDEQPSARASLPGLYGHGPGRHGHSRPPLGTAIKAHRHLIRTRQAERGHQEGRGAERQSGPRFAFCQLHGAVARPAPGDERVRLHERGREAGDFAGPVGFHDGLLFVPEQA